MIDSWRLMSKGVYYIAVAQASRVALRRNYCSYPNLSYLHPGSGSYPPTIKA